MFQRHSYSWRKLALSTLIVCNSLMAGACEDSSGPDDELEWQAALAGVGSHQNVEATAVVVSRATAFEAEIDIEDAPAAEVFAWRIAAGTCAQPGDRVGNANQYPQLTITANGTATAEADVTGELDEDEDYIVQVIDEGAATPVVVACGALELN